MDSEPKKTHQIEGTETFYSPRTPPQPVFNPYDVIPPPPPLNVTNPYEYTGPYHAPPSRHRRLLITLVSLLCLVVILSGVLFTLLYQHNQKTASIPGFTPTFVPTTSIPTLTPTATPTPASLLDNPDFATFVTAFNNNMAAGNWNAIAAHTDTTNFSNQYSYSDTNASPLSGDENWSKTYSDLQNGGLTTKVDIPLDFLNSNASLNCEQYSSNGVTGHQVNAHQVYYIYAWGSNSHLTVNGVVINPLRQIDAFEQVNTNGSWQWLGIFSHLSVDSTNAVVLDCEP